MRVQKGDITRNINVLGMSSFDRNSVDKSTTRETTSLVNLKASMENLSRKINWQIIKEYQLATYQRILRCIQDAYKMGFDEWYLVDLFVCGLLSDIEKGASLFKPKTLLDACCLAKLQESTHNFMVKIYGVECEGIELRVSERDHNNKCVSILDESCEEKMEDSSEIQEEKIYEDEEDEVNTGESVDSEFMVMEIDKFQDCVNRDERDYVYEGNSGSLAEQHERNICGYSVSIYSPYIKGKKVGEVNDLGKENNLDDISLVEMTTMFEKSKGLDVKKIMKRHGLGAMGYGDSLFPILGLDGYDGADETKLLTLNQIMQELTQNSNMVTTNFDRTTTCH
ncbi:hypothetical protein Tco_0211128 [Tanacetum coccineum]